MEKRNHESQHFFVKYLDIVLFFVFAIVIGILGFFNFYEKLDYRFYDMLLHLKKEPAQNKNILYAEIDDESIFNLGSWPWSRDIIADSLIHMKELGAERVVFDIEYLSPSNKTIHDDVIQNITGTLDYAEDSVINSFNELDVAISKKFGQSTKDDILEKGVIQPFFYLRDSVSKCYVDNDKKFQQALQFMGNTWLTVNTRDVNIPYNDTEYVNKRLLLNNVTDLGTNGGFIKKDNEYNSKRQRDERVAGFTPAIPQFTESARGIGFTNVNIDSDGTRRRIELLYKHDNQYAGQLVFAPLLDFLGTKSIERTKNALFLKDILIPGEGKSKDLKIPLDPHGRMLINWLHGDFKSSFKHIALYNIYRLEQKELQIYDNLRTIADSDPLFDEYGNFLQYYSQVLDLIQDYEDILAEKQSLLDLCTGYSLDKEFEYPISKEQYYHYFNKRLEYFTKLTNFRRSLYERTIYKAINELDSAYEESKDLFWKGLVGDFTIDEIYSKVWDSWNDEEYYENENRFGILTNLYCEIDLYNHESEFLRSKLDGAFCIIGETASSTTDMGATPFIDRYPNVGTHANVLNTILQEDFIKSFSWIYMYAIFVFTLGILIIALHGLNQKTQNIVLGLVSIVCILIPNILLPVFSIYIPITAIFLFVFLVYVSGLFLRFFFSSKEKEFIKQTFSQFVSADVVNEIIKNPKMAELGGRTEKITALFSDIKSFSSFSEKYNDVYKEGAKDPWENTPQRLVEILNEYLGSMSDVILKHNGTIDKYIGDSIVSMFGAPIANIEHAYDACVAAIEMKKVEADFNKKHILDGFISSELYTRIGLNSGEMLVGNMGTDMKKNYTMMGDNVNLASRLEGVNKAYSTWILASESTWNLANSGLHKGELVARKLDKVRVVGKTVPVQLYNIVGFRSELSRIQLEEIDVFHEALELYLNKKFEQAEKVFRHANSLVPEDRAPLVFAERCQDYIQKGVPENWDGIKNLTTK